MVMPDKENRTNNDMKDASSSYLYALISIIILALVWGYLITNKGINWSMDSAWYFVYARSLSEGDGLTAPINSWQRPEVRIAISQWPPLYSVILAAGGDSIREFARYVTILSLVASSTFVYLIGLRLYQDKWLPASLVTLLFLTIPAALADVFSVAHSEAPFTALSLVCLYLLLRYTPEKFPSIRLSIGLALVLSSAMLIRYIGAAFGGLALLVVIIQMIRGRQWNQILHVIVVLLSFVPLMLYLYYIWQETGSVTGAQSVSDKINLIDITLSLRFILLHLNHWLSTLLLNVGLASNWWVLLILIPLIAGGIFLSYLSRPIKLRIDILFILVGFVASYLCLFWLSAVTSDAVDAMDTRHYVVLYPVLLLLVAYFVVQWKSQFVVIPIIILWFWSSFTAFTTIQNGNFYNSKTYREHITPAFLEIAREFPSNTIWHTMHVSYLSHLLDNNTNVRSLTLNDLANTINCSDVLIPEGHEYAAFVAIDEADVYQKSSEQILSEFEQWISNCGEYVRIETAPNTVIILARFD